MKTRYIIILTLFLQSFNIYSQNIIEYNQLINKAELSIIDSNYTKALDFYHTAFSIVEYPFATDLYNALLCATFTENYDLSFEYMYKLVHKGILYKNFENNKYLKPLQTDQRWVDFKNYYDENHEKIIDGFNLELKAELDSMVAKDRAANKSRYKDPNLRPKFDSTIYANTIRLIEIIKNNGFPNENLMGIDNFTSIPFNIVLPFHYFQIINNKDSLEFFPILEKAVIDGNLNYKHFFGMCGYEFSNIYATKIAYLVDTNIIFPKISNEDVEYINKKRERLGIETYQESKEKTIFYIKKVFKPIPIKKDQEEYEYSLQCHDNLDSDYFIIGYGLFSNFIFKYEEIENRIENVRNIEIKIMKNE